jgi:hypothetical protein
MVNDNIATVRAALYRLPNSGLQDDALAALDALAARIDTLETALLAIQSWDCLNPPRSELCADHPWLKRLVDAALADAKETEA